MAEKPDPEESNTTPFSLFKKGAFGQSDELRRIGQKFATFETEDMLNILSNHAQVALQNPLDMKRSLLQYAQHQFSRSLHHQNPFLPSELSPGSSVSTHVSPNSKICCRVTFEQGHKYHGEVQHFEDGLLKRKTFEERHRLQGEVHHYEDGKETHRTFEEGHNKYKEVYHFGDGRLKRRTFEKGHEYHGQVQHYEGDSETHRTYEKGHSWEGEVHHFEDGPLKRRTFEKWHKYHGIVEHFDSTSVLLLTSYDIVIKIKKLVRLLRVVGKFALHCQRLLTVVRKRNRRVQPRQCTACGLLRPQAEFSATQWKRPEKKRKCEACIKSQPVEAPAAPAAPAAADTECAVCLETTPLQSRKWMQCTHWVCGGCINSMFARGCLQKCPLCRSPIHEITMRLLMQ